MLHRICRPAVVLAITLACTGAACSNSATQPSGTSTGSSDGSASASSVTGSVAAPRPLQPQNGATVRNADQPLTLVVQNAVVTKQTGTTYLFEVATDSAFVSKVQSKDGVAEGTNGQTGVRLDALAPSTDYYWHVRARSAGTTGVFGSTFKFTVGPPVVINPPVPLSPLTGSRSAGRPTLRVTNATHTGPTGALTYTFEIAATSTFTPVLQSGTAPEGTNETDFAPNSDLTVGSTYFWRATATDAASGASSTPSVVQSFVADVSAAAAIAAKLGVPLWPGAQPPGSNGHAVLGNFWNVEPVKSFDGVTFINPPIEEVRIFDLLDRGFDPQAAIDWMNGHGYPTIAAYYPDVNVIGFQFEYLALVNGQWNVVLKVGA